MKSIQHKTSDYVRPITSEREIDAQTDTVLSDTRETRKQISATETIEVRLLDLTAGQVATVARYDHSTGAKVMVRGYEIEILETDERHHDFASCEPLIAELIAQL